MTPCAHGHQCRRPPVSAATPSAATGARGERGRSARCRSAWRRCCDIRETRLRSPAVATATRVLGTDIEKEIDPTKSHEDITELCKYGVNVHRICTDDLTVMDVCMSLKH